MFQLERLKAKWKKVLQVKKNLLNMVKVYISDAIDWRLDFFSVYAVLLKDAV